MNLLAIDTSTDCASVALMINGELRTREQPALRQHARELLPMIEQLLAETGANLNQLDGIAYGRGPGSFTGLRISCSVAKGLAYAHDLPLLPASSLATIANEACYQNKENEETGFLTLLDARMNQVYWACFTDNLNEAEEFVSDVATITLVNDYPLILAGVGFEPYYNQLPLAVQARIIKQCTIYPHAQTMIRMALAGQLTELTPAEALPVYIRNQITQGEPRG
ncbi:MULTISPECIES: tRNA (adenosine(37)-N6)-threonylcarbamoyltransferase complex dimerization subunit type 1 TsaB [unclassified Legionella]|uniref:tRNA (adenosine(37)-N6)-threonylcarbamoyltransferase complex dimerization subunit type 1 TsaB n=1 Tax=unclassified Legionella TaxID=2622702 RepID=UPI0010549EF9|nr:MULTISPECIES: tRNA (adenosine(37)-N6)-threonylcarbamoyltransferase complex dimerization subunit type 1 TsaB [unclassified Legionella]MDI9818134.1 tRNA (adenosine(37)-N6)-threonylcarbamoyltransferase complex dimerization subunit type 1 TsaB [Legionella sp. PL877]